jgi:ketosteroid isomerase-like protein
MTQDSRAIAELFWSRLQSGDREGVLDLLADEVDWFVPGRPEVVPWAGARGTKDEVREFLGMLGGAMVGVENDVQAVLGDGDDAVVVGFFRHRSKATDRIFASEYALHLRVKDGKVIRYHIYEDTEALVRALHP